MSFLSDLFEGNFSQLGGDLTHHPLETVAALALPLAGIAAPFLAPGLLGGGAVLGAGAGEAGAGLAGAASGVTAGDLAAGAGLGSLDAVAAGLTPSGNGFIGAGPSGILDANASSPLDTAVFPSGPVGAPTGTTAAPSAVGAGPGAVAPPAGVNAPADLTAAAPGATSAANAVTGPTAAPTSFLDKLIGSAGSAVTKNPVGTALAAGGLAYNVMSGQKQSAAVQALEGQAAQAAAQGTTLQSYLANGTLPPAIQAQLTQATAAARARILANYANTPGGADPTKNSALAQELNNLDLQAVASASQVEQQLLQSGISEFGLASNTLTTLANIDQAQSARIGQSIASFAAALSGGPTGGVTLKLAA